MILRGAAQRGLKPAEGVRGTIRLNCYAAIGKTFGLIFVGEKNRVHGDDTQPVDMPRLKGVTAKRLPFPHEAATFPDKSPSRPGRIAQEGSSGLTVVVATVIVVVARGEKDLRLAVALAQLEGNKGHRLRYKSTVVIAVGVGDGFCVLLWKSMGQQVTGDHH